MSDEEQKLRVRFVRRDGRRHDDAASEVTWDPVSPQFSGEFWVT